MIRRLHIAMGVLAVAAAGCGDGSAVTNDVVDTTVDVLFPDTGVPDAGSPDTGQPDSNVPDGTEPDVPDTTAPDTVDTIVPPLAVDFCRLQFPLELSEVTGSSVDIFGRVYVAGLTDQSTSNDADARLTAKLGYGPVDSDPSTWTEWLDADANSAWDGAAASEPDNDEYMATFVLPAVGDYDYAFAFSVDGAASFTYCDKDAGEGQDGSEDGYQTANSGVLSALADPCDPNPCMEPQAVCDGAVLRVFPATGSCAVDSGAPVCTYTPTSEENCADDGKSCDPISAGCVDDPCNPNPCDVAPAPACDGNNVVTYVATGTCDDGGGTSECTYAEASSDSCGSQFCTDGACNDWRVVEVGDVVITEIMADPTTVSDVDGEWFEVTNTASVSVNLKGVVVTDLGTSNFTVDTDLIIDADGGHAVFGRNADTATNGDVAVDYVYSGMLLVPSDADAIILSLADGTVLDSVTWEASWPFSAGAALSVAPGSEDDNDLAASWCAAYTAYGDGDFGTPGMSNDACSVPLSFCRLQFPLDVAVVADTDVDAFARIFVAGFTDIGAANATHPLLVGQLGYGDDASDPSTWTQWSDAMPNDGYDDSSADYEAANDEYTATLSGPSDLGSYEFAFRFSGDGGMTWLYCDRDPTGAGGNDDGSTDGYQSVNGGKLTVQADPCAPNPCTVPPNGCEGADVVIYGDTGTCNVVDDAADCTYSETTRTTCLAGEACDSSTLACVNDPCSPNPCTDGQAATCDGNTVVTYLATGSCAIDGAAVDCSYAEDTRSDCTGAMPICDAGACVDYRPADVGDLLITEIMTNPAVSDSNGEFFEVYNRSADRINLKGLTFKDLDTDSFDIDADVIVEAGAYAVLGKKADLAVNGNIPVDYAYGSAMAMSASDELQVLRDDVQIDLVDWSGGGWPVNATGISMSLDPNKMTSELDNDSDSAWCLSYTSFETSLASPGAEGDACSVTIGFCRLQAPESADVAIGGTLSVTGRVWIAGITDVGTGNADVTPLVSEVGFGSDADPEVWTWVSAAPNAAYADDEASNDEYIADINVGDAAGSYALAFRFSGDGGDTWTLCDRNVGPGADGSEDGFAVVDAGVLTVLDPCDPNPCTAGPANLCDGEVATVTTEPGSCTLDALGAAACSYEQATTDCAVSGQRCDSATVSCVDCLGDSDCSSVFLVCDGTNSCVTGCQEDTYSGNSASATAEALATDIEVEDLVICDETAGDWFSVALGVGDSLDVTVDFVNATPLELKLFDPAGVEVSGVALGDAASAILLYTVPAGADGTYTFQVSGALTTYDMLVSFANNACVPNPCTSVPAASCDGADVVTYESACADNSGTPACTYPEASRTTCSNFCTEGACTDWRLAAAQGDLVITEIMQRPVSDGAEYFELHNPTADTLNLVGLSIARLGSEVVDITTELLVAPGGYVVLGASNDLVGGVAPDYVYGTFPLEDDDLLIVSRGAVTLDDISWSATDFPVADFASMQLDPASLDTTSNDSGNSWCTSYAAIDGVQANGYGTPGAANGSCPTIYMIDFCRLQSPVSATLAAGDTADAFARLYVGGLTDVNTAGNDTADFTLMAQVGVGLPSQAPGTWMTWSDATTNDSYGSGSPGFEANNDEYTGVITAPVDHDPTPGDGDDVDYHFAFRFSGDGGVSWTYCDADPDGDNQGGNDGSADGYQAANAGQLMVTEPVAATGTLYFSEFIEGGSNNKALEIYNGNNAEMDLDGCFVRTYFNGSSSASQNLALTGTLASGSTLVICHGSASSSVLSFCGDASAIKHGVAGFSGDDAVALECGGEVLDVVGKIGEDPSIGYWGNSDSGSDNDSVRTKDRTINRCGVTSGDTDGSDDFEPHLTGTWLGAKKDNGNTLGSHVVDCPVVAPQCGPALDVIDDGSTATAPLPDLVMAEVAPGTHIVLFNTTDTDIALSGVDHQLCSPFSYSALSVIAGDVTVPSLGYATIIWPAAFTDTAAGGEVILYSGGSFGDYDTVLDFVCWGTNPHGSRKSDVEGVAKWSGDCAVSLDNGAIRRNVGQAGTDAADYAVDAAQQALNCTP